MPFDPIPQQFDDQAARNAAASALLSCQTALYRQRRESAAVLWRSIPERQFNMQSWGCSVGNLDIAPNYSITGEYCGTHGCALGWLALRQHDGWRWIKGRQGYGRPMPPNGFSRAPTKGAAVYFGMPWRTAASCFVIGCANWEETYPCEHEWWITPADVAAAVLAAPYVTSRPA